MLSNLSNNNSGNKTKSVVEKKHYEEIENRLDEMQTEIDANSSAIAQNASDIETLDDRIDAVEENSTFESINTDTIYPATGQTVTVDGDELVTGTLAAHDINTTELTVDGVSFDDVVDNSVTALTNSRAANYTANQARTKANEVDGKVDNLISSMAQELDTDLLKAEEGRISSLTGDVATIDEIFSYETTTDILNADMVKASGKLVRPTIDQPYYTIDIPENCITTLKGTFTVDGVTKRLFISSTPGSLYYYQESLEIIKTISFNRATGAARIVLKTDDDFDYISISNGDTVTILDGDNAYANYVYIPAKLRGVITRGFWTNETETVVTGILKAYQLQAENEHFESTSVDDLFIEKSLNVPEQWDQSGIACFSSGLPDQYLSIDTMDGVTHPRWKDSANEATGTLNETNRLVTEESVAKWNGTSCDGTNEYYPITNIGDNAEVHGSATVDENLTVTCDATVGGDLTVTGLAHLNADSADKLHTARCINGTAFDGTDDITTSKWGTARTITVQDNDGTNSTCTENVDGSADITLSLPATIKADVNGTACNAKCIEIKADSCNAEYNIPFETTSNATYQELGKDSCLKFNPSTNQLSTDRLCGTECVDTPLLKATQADITCNFTVGKNAVIAGDLTVAGTMHVNETENISTGADIITMRTNNNSSLGTGCVSGLFINNYDGVNSMVLGTDKNGTFRVGDSAGTSTSYAEIYTDDENWYNGTYPNGVQFTFSGSLTSYSQLRIETDTSVTPPKTYKIYDDAVITSVDISDMEPLATRAEAADMQDGYVAVWDCAGTDLVTNVNEAKVHGLKSDCKVCGVDFHGTTFFGTDFCGCLHGDVDGNAATASKVATASNTTCATFYPTFVDSNNGTAANESVYTDADLNYNPDTNVLSVPNVNASGKVCGGCFTSDDTAYIKAEEQNELNIYPTVAGNTWINYRGGGSTLSVGDGSCTGCYGTVKAATFCGNLVGNFCGCKWLDTGFYSSADRNLVISSGVYDGINDHGVSAVCSLTFNPNTGVMKNSGNECAGYHYYIGNSNSWSSYKYVKITASNSTRLITARSYHSVYQITIDETPFVSGIGYNDLYGIRGWAKDTNFSIWIQVIGYAPILFFSSSPLTFTETTTAPAGVTFSDPYRIDSQVETTATSCNANYYLTFVDSNNGTVARENVYTNAGLYYNPSDKNLKIVSATRCTELQAGYVDYWCGSPFIDMHYNYYSGDYTTRLVDSAQGRFDVIVNNGTGSTTATQSATYCFYSSGSLAVPGKVVTPKVEAGGNLTLSTDVNNTQYCMCLCGANGVLYNPQGYNVPVTKAASTGDNAVASWTDCCAIWSFPEYYRNYIGSSVSSGACWRNVISIRHKNGYDNGDKYGTILYQPMTTAGHWCYDQQINGTWQGSKQLIDSTGGQTIAGNLTVHNSSNNAVLTADFSCSTIRAVVGTPIVCTSTQAGSNGTEVNAGSLELYNSIPFIDFHTCHACADFSHRIISYNGCLQVAATNATGCTVATQSAKFDFCSNGIFGTTSLKVCDMAVASSASTPISLTCGSYKIELGCGDNIAIGCAAMATSDGNIAIGNDARACTGNFSVAIGSGACAHDDSVAIGDTAFANSVLSVAVGSNANANSNYSVAVGAAAFANCADSIAIGESSCANGACSIAIGCHASTNLPMGIAIGCCACAKSGTWLGQYVDCHVVYTTGASAHFRFGEGIPQCAVYCALACQGVERSPMWPIGCGCTYRGRHMVPAKWIWRNGTCSDAGNWLSWDGDGNIDLTGHALGSDHCICGTCTCTIGVRLEIWADWPFDYCTSI